MEPSRQQAYAQQPEYRDPRFAALDAEIRAKATIRPTARTQRPKRTSGPVMPLALVKAVVRAARTVKIKHRAQFMENPKLKDQAARLFRLVLPPKPKRRGRPAIDSVTIASRLLRNLKKRFPSENQPQVWARIYPVAIPHWETMSPDERKTAALQLRNRVRSRRNRRRHSRQP